MSSSLREELLERELSAEGTGGVDNAAGKGLLLAKPTVDQNNRQAFFTDCFSRQYSVDSIHLLRLSPCRQQAIGEVVYLRSMMLSAHGQIAL